MTNNFIHARLKLVSIYLLIIGCVIILFSCLVVYQANDSFSDPAVVTDKEIVLTASAAEQIAQNTYPEKEITETEYEIERNILYYTVSFADESEVKIDLLTGTASIPSEDVGLLISLTDDFDEMVVWIGLSVFLLAALLSVYVVHNTLHPIAHAMAVQKQFVADAAHELRNPLAAIHARIESIQRSGAQAYTAKVFSDLLKETKQLIALSEGLLAFELLERKTPLNQTQPIETVCADVIQQFTCLAENKKIALHTSTDTHSLLIHEQDAHTILYNLIHNAIKFTPEHGEIRIAIQGKKLTVSDTGIGIATEHIPFLFNRLYKVDTARSDGGVGLGLALVKTITDRYGAKIDVVSAVGKGTTVTICFT
jgi:signal transduction histidine kinase